MHPRSVHVCVPHMFRAGLSNHSVHPRAGQQGARRGGGSRQGDGGGERLAGKLVRAARESRTTRSASRGGQEAASVRCGGGGS
eukprot:6549156-Pyramimonas_sp.AAC.1